MVDKLPQNEGGALDCGNGSLYIRARLRADHTSRKMIDEVPSGSRAMNATLGATTTVRSPTR
ncbi:MAG: hypothetical protein AB7N54_13645 [Alphaproteobacteria bacterium]